MKEPHIAAGLRFGSCMGLWIVPVVGLKSPSVVVSELLVADVAGSVAAVFGVGLARVELVFVLHAAHSGQEQGLPVDLQFEPSYRRRRFDGLFQVLTLVEPAQYPRNQ